eukprot:9467783-Pyramimonas_sp.AAC.1
MVPREHEVRQSLRFLCCECGATLESKCAWHGHRTKVHGNNDDIPWYAYDGYCAACDVNFHTRKRLIYHLKYRHTECIDILRGVVEPLDDEKMAELDKTDMKETAMLKAMGYSESKALRPPTKGPRYCRNSRSKENMNVSIPQVLMEEVHNFGNEESANYQCVDRESQLLLLYDSEGGSTAWLDSFHEDGPFQIKMTDIRTMEIDAIATYGMSHKVVADICKRKIFGVVGQIYGYMGMRLWGGAEIRGRMWDKQTRANAVFRALMVIFHACGRASVPMCVITDMAMIPTG